ncbi:hypothetical protein E1956_32375 [Paraburkholderia pallida]|uniref:Peptidase n=1 Tax=Paraburkholderia pallida TaxID=2547399 RepID=A0A4P7CZP2_9BURK|nr:hypothetical protein [Paraburkholderia pallida]QBR01841.1 hypothetical protein E1956_32375 [Paraburkholderia pallida]
MRRNLLRVCLAAATCLLGACSAANSTTPSTVVGADRDAHGCIGSAGYSWCAHTQRCERPWELAKQQGFASSEANFAQYCATGTVN